MDFEKLGLQKFYLRMAKGDEYEFQVVYADSATSAVDFALRQRPEAAMAEVLEGMQWRPYPDVERALRTLAMLIDGGVPEGWGLFLVPFGENEPAPKGKGSVFWISNSERAGMMDAIKGWIADQEKRKKE